VSFTRSEMHRSFEHRYFDLYEDDKEASPWESDDENDLLEDVIELQCVRCPADGCSRQSWGKVRKSTRHSLERLQNQIYTHLRCSGLHESLSDEECKEMVKADRLEVEQVIITKAGRKKERNQWKMAKNEEARAAKEAAGAEPKHGKRSYSSTAGKSSGSGQIKRQQTEDLLSQATSTMQGALAALCAKVGPQSAAVGPQPAARPADDDAIEIVPRSLAVVPADGLSPDAHTARVNVSLGDLLFVKDQIDRSSLAVNCASRTLVDSVKTLQNHGRVLSEVSDSLGKIIRKASTPTTIIQ
jgi:hypothetical protein